MEKRLILDYQSDVLERERGASSPRHAHARTRTHARARTVQARQDPFTFLTLKNWTSGMGCKTHSLACTLSNSCPQAQKHNTAAGCTAPGIPRLPTPRTAQTARALLSKNNLIFALEIRLEFYTPNYSTELRHSSTTLLKPTCIVLLRVFTPRGTQPVLHRIQLVLQKGFSIAHIDFVFLLSSALSQRNNNAKCAYAGNCQHNQCSAEKRSEAERQSREIWRWE